ncbi:MAG: peptidoglycan-binding protein [Candidatus Paceibacterota bacterium]|jgi:hypothetical protein
MKDQSNNFLKILKQFTLFVVGVAVFLSIPKISKAEILDTTLQDLNNDVNLMIVDPLNFMSFESYSVFPIFYSSFINKNESDPVYATTTSCFRFSEDINIGKTGMDVVALQDFLIDNGCDIPAISSGRMSKGYFGYLTLRSLTCYQNSQGLPATGFVDIETRAQLNSSCSIGISTNGSLIENSNTSNSTSKPAGTSKVNNYISVTPSPTPARNRSNTSSTNTKAPTPTPIKNYYTTVSTPTPTPTFTPYRYTVTPSPTVSPTPTSNYLPTYTPSPSPTSTFTPTPSPASTPTPSPTSSPTPTPIITPTPTPTPTPSSSPSPTPTYSPSPSPTPTPSGSGLPMSINISQYNLGAFIFNAIKGLFNLY